MNHGPDEKGPEGLESDESALRRLLQSAVEDMEPRDGALDHLRRAVPARRARKRQAAVGMAAAALFIGTAIPALVHVSDSGGSDPDTAMAGQSSQAQGGAGQEKNPDGGTGATRDGGKNAGPGKGASKDPGHGRSGGTGGGTGGPGPSPSVAASAPLCTAAQLGSTSGSAAAPDSAGVVYGVFRVTNVSGGSCTVGGVGTIGLSAQGAADAAKVRAARHVAGDAAAGLPDPSQEVAALILQPGAAYEEKFAFVPSGTCPTTGGSTTGGTGGGSSPSPDPSPTQDAGTTSGAGTGGSTSGATTQLLTEDGPADGSVVVSHTPQAGSPTVSATVPDECAGVVYWTGVLAAP
ncbi:hypothetical protein [Streptomyces sp. NPDC006739]|uniref:hypothetical protein n=1 Tax=Streptomyces sp. NPDC006739 TaxID=3364763 RepID=UPI00369BA057